MEKKTNNVKKSKKMKTFKEYYLEDVRVQDKTGKAVSWAKQYIKTYKDTFRGAPELKQKDSKEFILTGKDDKFLAKLIKDMFKDIKLK